MYEEPIDHCTSCSRSLNHFRKVQAAACLNGVVRKMAVLPPYITVAGLAGSFCGTFTMRQGIASRPLVFITWRMNGRLVLDWWMKAMRLETKSESLPGWRGGLYACCRLKVSSTS